MTQGLLDAAAALLSTMLRIGAALGANADAPDTPTPPSDRASVARQAVRIARAIDEIGRALEKADRS